MTHTTAAVAGLVVLVLGASGDGAWADWKSRAAKEAVGRTARAGMETAVKDAAMDAALGAVVPDRPRAPDLGRAKAEVGAGIGSAAGSGIGSAAGEGIEAAMTAVDVAASIDAAVEVADAAKNLNKVRKAIK